MKKLLCLTLVSVLLAQPLAAQTLDETFTTTEGLTDGEQSAANNYYHQGVADKVLAEQCKKLKTGCNDQTGKPGEVLGGFEDALPKLYAVMGTLAAGGVGNKIAMKPKAGATTPAPAPAAGTGAEAKPEKNEKSDYCIYIPLAGEAISMVTQKQAESNIQQTAINNQADLQRESLYAVARTHQARAKTAKMQATIYAGTGACYVAYLAMGADPKAPMLWVKMGAAVAMSAIFFKKAGKHEEYANSLKEIAKKLPGAGDCNPYTNTNCFCAQESSVKSDTTNYQKYCVAKALVNNGAPGTQVACATLNSSGAAVADVSCACKASNSCVNAQLQGLVGQIGLGSIGFNEPLAMMNNLTGSFQDGTMASTSLGLNARTNRALAGSGVSKIPDLSTAKNKPIVDKLKDLGLPGNVAGFIAGQQGAELPSNDATSPAMQIDAAPSAVASASGAKIPGYNSASSSRNSGGGSDDGGFVNPLGNLGKKTEKASAVQIETFAEAAIKEADITKDSSRGIFDIISNRYRNSAWNRFDVQPANSPSP